MNVIFVAFLDGSMGEYAKGVLVSFATSVEPWTIWGARGGEFGFGERFGLSYARMQSLRDHLQPYELQA